jgi:hypothetical protein
VDQFTADDKEEAGYEDDDAERVQLAVTGALRLVESIKDDVRALAWGVRDGSGTGRQQGRQRRRKSSIALHGEGSP